jgi:hypothetical protein
MKFAVLFFVFSFFLAFSSFSKGENLRKLKRNGKLENLMKIMKRLKLNLLYMLKKLLKLTKLKKILKLRKLVELIKLTKFKKIIKLTRPKNFGRPGHVGKLLRPGNLKRNFLNFSFLHLFFYAKTNKCFPLISDFLQFKERPSI